MSVSHNILIDQSKFSYLDRLFFKLETLLNLMAGFFVFVIVIASMINIIGRGFFNQPFFGYFDLMAQSVPLIAFFGIAYCQRLGGHIRLDILLGQLKGRFLWLIEAILCLLMLVTTLALSYGAWLHTLRAYQIGDSTEDIGFLIWPVKFLIFMMFLLLSLRFLIQLVGYIKLTINPLLKPIGVPVLLSIEEQAKLEAQLE